MCRLRTTGRCLVLRAAPGLILALLVSACARSTAVPSTAEPGPVAAPTAALRRAAAAESRRPSTSAMSAPVPDGVEPLLGVVIAADDARSRMPLSDVLAELAGPAPEPRPATANAESLRRYIQGRSKLLSGDAAAAVEDLKAATELDPEASEPWRELGEAQLALGQRAEALRSFRAATASGGGDARSLELLGRTALERGDFEEAGRFLARAMHSGPGRSDPALPSVIGIGLARALAAQGYTLAAFESLKEVLTGQPRLTSSSRYAGELGAIFRRQGDLWRDVGDALCRLGRFDEAVEAYRTAAELPSLDRTPTRPRLVFALMRSGKPSAASLEILEDLAGRQGRVNDADLGLLRFVASHGGNVGHISDALRSLRTAEKAPSLARDLSLARARLLTGPASAAALRGHVQEFPADAAAAVELFNTFPTPTRALEEATAIVGRRPDLAKLAAEAYLRSTHGVAPLGSPNENPASRLLWAYITAKQGRVSAALDFIVELPATDAVGVAAAAAVVEIGLDAGRPDIAEQSVASLNRATASTETRRVLARSQVMMQQVVAAEATILPVLNETGVPTMARIEDLLLGADIASRLGRGEETERRLTEAAALDPFDERPLSLLMVLYSAEGQTPDNVKLARFARDLRQNAPGSRTIRMLRARELMRRQQLPLADAELRALVEEDPGEAGAMELLATTWVERAKQAPATADESRTWLANHLRRRPQSALLLATLSSLEVSTNRSAEAERALREALAAGAGPDVSRLLERLLRDSLDRPAEADDLARARLASRRRTAQESVEFAELSLSWGETESALSILAEGLPPGIDLTADQARQCIALASRCIVAMRSLATPGQAAADATRVFDRCLPSIPQLPSESHQRRIEALAAVPDVTKEQLIRAVSLWTQQHPQAAPSAHLAAVQALIMAKRTELAPDLLAAAVAAGASDARVLSLWFDAVVEFGSAKAGREMIDEVHRIGKLRSLMDRVAPNINAETVRDLRAEAAYLMGILFTQLNRDQDAATMYEYALGFDPDHAWVCNNLGYWLADRGVELERASKLLEHAYAVMPQETPIIDSLAWLRYKQGIIFDQVDPATGEVIRRGAASLLVEAAQTAMGQVDNTIQDHLGDALWLAGKREEAIAAWELASMLSRRTLDLAAANAAPDDPASQRDTAEVVESRALIKSTTLKREAAAANKPVPVAPQIADQNPLPRQPRPDERP